MWMRFSPWIYGTFSILFSSFLQPPFSFQSPSSSCSSNWPPTLTQIPANRGVWKPSVFLYKKQPSPLGLILKKPLAPWPMWDLLSFDFYRLVLFLRSFGLSCGGSGPKDLLRMSQQSASSVHRSFLVIYFPPACSCAGESERLYHHPNALFIFPIFISQLVTVYPLLLYSPLSVLVWDCIDCHWLTALKELPTHVDLKTIRSSWKWRPPSVG